MLLVRRVQGASMQPGLEAGRVVVACRARRLRPGDVVIARHDGLEKIKRIDRLTIDRVYLLGDNAAASTDSRHFGWIPRQAIIAKVLWPKAELVVQ